MSAQDRPIAILTGATGGIGGEIARLLIARGYDVHALTRRPEHLAQELPGLGAHLVPIACDLTDAQDCEAVARGIVAQGLPVQLLIHCAGSIRPQNVADIEADALLLQLAINLTAPILLTRHLVPAMVRGGHIAFVNSMAGVLPLEGNSVYTATKFGLRGFARSIALDLRPRGIGVSSVFPGAVDTPMLTAEMESGGSSLNFVSTPLSPHALARTIVSVCHARNGRSKGGEFFRPRIDGAFSHACLMMPWLLRLALPILRRVGAAGQRRYIRSRAAS